MLLNINLFVVFPSKKKNLFVDLLYRSTWITSSDNISWINLGTRTAY